MKVAITGSHGLIGSAVARALLHDGHEVRPLVRGVSGAGTIGWDVQTGDIDLAALNGVDVVIHLAGAGVGDRRWSASYREEILGSRRRGTEQVAAALAQLPTPPRVLLSASAVGFYGCRGDQVLFESSPRGDGFLADVCGAWEAATTRASDAGIRVVHLRSGVVMSAAGGALKKQLPLFKACLGARLGHGDHYLSWVTRSDLVRALQFLMAADCTVSGPVNLTAPNPVTNAEFTAALGRAVRRPAKLAVPVVALRVAAGRQMMEEFFLASQRAVPQRLVDAGFSFADPFIDAALAAALDDKERDIALRS